MEFSLSPKRVLKILLSIIAVLTFLHIMQLGIYFQTGDPEVFDFIELVDFDYEANLPSLYSSVAILFCAGLLWCIGTQKRQEQAPFKYHWIGLAVIFTFLLHLLATTFRSFRSFRAFRAFIKTRCFMNRHSCL